jgi:hypothetical protein
MPPEECGICGATVALGDAAHVMLNAKSEEGVRDYYVCPTCFEEELVPHFPERDRDTGVDDGDDEGDQNDGRVDGERERRTEGGENEETGHERGTIS